MLVAKDGIYVFSVHQKNIKKRNIKYFTIIRIIKSTSHDMLLGKQGGTEYHSHL